MRRAALLCLALAGCATMHARPGAPEAAGTRGWRAWLAGDVAGAATAFAAGDADDARAAFGRALVAHERADWEHAWNLWLDVLEGATRHPRDPWWAAFADMAASKVEQLVGEVPGEARQAAVLAKLEVADLPLEAHRRVLGMRANYARRLGHEDEARALDRQRGCPGRWFIAGAYGTLPRLDLAAPFAADGDGDRQRLRALPVRGCSVTAEAERGRSGVLYAVQWFHAAQPLEAEVVVDTDVPWRLYVDGKLAFDGLDEAHVPARVRRLSLPLASGWHRVALKLAGDNGRATADISVYAEAPRGKESPLAAWSGDVAQSAPSVAPGKPEPARLLRPALPEVPESGEGPASSASIDRSLVDFLAAYAGYRLGDTDAGEAALARLIARAPKFAPAQLVASQLANEDDARPGRLARDRARRALLRALALDPTLERARYNLALMELNADRPREALARLDEVHGAHGWRFAYARHQALKQRGWAHEAELALAEARRLDPEACPALTADVGWKRERHDVRGAQLLARWASTCGGGSDELADLLRATGDMAGAIAEYKRLLALDPMREQWRAGLAETLAQAGDDAASAAELTGLVARYPKASHYRRELADRLFALGRPAEARKVIEEGLGESPESAELHRALAALCPDGPRERCPGIMDAFRVDGQKVIAEFERDHARPNWDTPAVIVLDRTVTRVFPTGARLTLTHNIVRVRTKEAIDKFGELTIPADADVLTLRTVKADGTTREPEELGGDKESISVPDLEPGDYVEYEYIDPSAPPAAFPGGFLAERFYFASYDAPLYRSEYLIATPPGMKLQLDRRGIGAPTATEASRDGLDVLTFRAHAAEQRFTEPSQAPFEEFLPSVRVGANLSLVAWKDFLTDASLLTARANQDLVRVAAEVTHQAHSDADKARALDAWVRKRIKQGGSLDEAATSILAREEGSRVTLLTALLRAAGVPATVWLAHPPRAAELDGQLPDLEGFDEPFLSAAGLQIDPRFRHGATGFLAPALRGGRAFALARGAVQLGHVGEANPDDRRMDFDVHLAADGAGEVTVRERLIGWPAVEWREALEKLAADRVNAEFEQRTLGFHFPGASLVSLGFEHRDDDGQPFIVTYRFRAPQLARRVGRALVLSAPFAAQLGRRYVGVATRTTPMLLDYSPPTRVHARIALPAHTAAALPAPVRAEVPFGLFEQSIVPAGATAGDAVELDARFAMSEARLPAAKYGELVDFAQRVDRAEARALEIRPAQ